MLVTSETSSAHFRALPTQTRGCRAAAVIRIHNSRTLPYQTQTRRAVRTTSVLAPGIPERAASSMCGLCLMTPQDREQQRIHALARKLRSKPLLPLRPGSTTEVSQTWIAVSAYPSRTALSELARGVFNADLRKENPTLVSSIHTCVRITKPTSEKLWTGPSGRWNGKTITKKP